MTDRRQHIYVTLRYDNASTAIDWLTSTLGLVAQEVHTEDDGTIAHALLAFAEDLIMVGNTRGEAPADGVSRP